MKNTKQILRYGIIALAGAAIGQLAHSLGGFGSPAGLATAIGGALAGIVVIYLTGNPKEEE